MEQPTSRPYSFVGCFADSYLTAVRNLAVFIRKMALHLAGTSPYRQETFL